MSDRIKESAIRAWQHDLAKFFPKSKGPTNAEIRMFELGYRLASDNIRHTIEYALKNFTEVLDKDDE